MIPAIKKTVTVPLAPGEAFRVFTEDLELWWPVETHSLSAKNGDRPRSVSVEARKGGKITETLPDGTTSDWATITDWRDGEGFAFDWYVGRDPADATQVRVTFVGDGAETVVTLVHDGFDRLGKEGAAMAANYDRGWNSVLAERFGGACHRRAA